MRCASIVASQMASGTWMQIEMMMIRPLLTSAWVNAALRNRTWKLRSAMNSVGASHASYRFNDRQWELATDAATPVAFWREDLLRAHGVAVPSTWDDVLELARRGHVEIPAAPINCLMNFYTFCIAAGETPFAGTERIASRDVARRALARMRELVALCDPGCWSRNPIASHDLVASAGNTHLMYCPLAYGYSNYARAGYAAHRLTAGETPCVDGQPLRTTLGGAGLAISASVRNGTAAAAYAEFVASGPVQRALYTHAGGQPGHRSAWTDAENNRIAHDYFAATLPVLDRAYLRPRYPGYLKFQDDAGPILQRVLQGRADDNDTLNDLDALYRDSLATHATAA